MKEFVGQKSTGGDGATVAADGNLYVAARAGVQVFDPQGEPLKITRRGGPSTPRIAAGIHSDLAKWWSITAKLRGASDDRDGAVAAWREAVSIGKHVSLPHAESVYTKVMVADMLRGLADALFAYDRLDDAASAVEERKEILRSVGLPENAA